MEALAVIAGGLYVASNLFNKDTAPDTPAHVQWYASQGDWLAHEFHENGMIAPSFTATSESLPWSMSNPPYYIHQVGDHNQDAPLDNAFQLRVNQLEHHRADFEEQFVRGRGRWGKKRGGAIYAGFTKEMELNGRSTDQQYWNWVPPNPTDSDFNDAAQHAKELPPDPMLFTPDAYYPTAPGLPFRYAPY